jgi:hypothetical protein
MRVPTSSTMRTEPLWPKREREELPGAFSMLEPTHSIYRTKAGEQFWALRPTRIRLC